MPTKDYDPRAPEPGIRYASGGYIPPLGTTGTTFDYINGQPVTGVPVLEERTVSPRDDQRIDFGARDKRPEDAVKLVHREGDRVVFPRPTWTGMALGIAIGIVVDLVILWAIGRAGS